MLYFGVVLNALVY